MPSRRSRDLTWIPRALGLATAAYSAAVIVRPALLAGPTGLTTRSGEVPSGTAIGVRTLGGRDLASGLAMAFAPAGAPLRTAIAVRVGCDLTDVVVFGTALPDPTARAKAAGVGALWGALCGLSARWA